MVFESNSYEETKNIGQQIAAKLHAGDILALGGDLGAGKTVITSGIAEYFGFVEGISSPTFTIVNQYDAPNITLYHLDVYRIEKAEEMYDIGLEDMLYSDGITIIEWAEKIEKLLPSTAILVRMERDYSKGDNYRLITVDWGENR